MNSTKQTTTFQQIFHFHSKIFLRKFTKIRNAIYTICIDWEVLILFKTTWFSIHTSIAIWEVVVDLIHFKRMGASCYLIKALSKENIHRSSFLLERLTFSYQEMVLQKLVSLIKNYPTIITDKSGSAGPYSSSHVKSPLDQQNFHLYE